MDDLSDRRVSDAPMGGELLRRLTSLLDGQDFQRLEQLADEASTLALAGDDDVAIAVAGECRAQADYHLGRYPAALRAFGEAIGRWRALGDREGEARTRLGQAGVLAVCGLATESMETAHAALALVDDDSDPTIRIGALLAMARGQTVLRAFDDAGRLYQRALAVAHACAPAYQIVRVLVDLGYFHCERCRQARLMGDQPTLRIMAAQGLAYNQQALRHLATAGSSKLEWVATANLGECQMDLGQLPEARATIEAMLRSVRSAPAPSAYCEGEGLLGLGQISLAAGDPVQALRELTEALAIARRDGMNELVMRTCELLTTANEQLGDFRSALRHHKDFFKVHTEILSEAAHLRAEALGYQLQTAEAHATADAERERAVALVRDNVALRRESLEDSLTGLPNHRAFQRALQRFVEEHADGREFFLAVIDVDHFKAINDRHSHVTGNEVLKALASLLRTACREHDVVARYGGEEFTLLLPASTHDKACGAAERIRRSIEGHDWNEMGAGIVVTVSIGVAGSLESADSTRLFEIADGRLYRAKGEGRNRVIAGD